MYSSFGMQELYVFPKFSHVFKSQPKVSNMVSGNDQDKSPILYMAHPFCTRIPLFFLQNVHVLSFFYNMIAFKFFCSLYKLLHFLIFFTTQSSFFMLKLFHLSIVMHLSFFVFELLHVLAHSTLCHTFKISHCLKFIIYHPFCGLLFCPFNLHLVFVMPLKLLYLIVFFHVILQLKSYFLVF